LPFAFSLHEFFLQFLAILIMLAVLTILIIVHECGHFSVARLFGFQTPVFGFGLPFFGPSWVLGRKWGTEFRLHALLIGGYVAIPELNDESSAEQAFNVQLKPLKKFPIWQRALVAFAGPGFNIIFAYFIMMAMLVLLGEPIQSTFVYSLPKENPIAANAGILPKDQLLTINGEFVSSPSDAVTILSGHKNEEVKIDVKRTINGVEQQLSFSMNTNDAGKVGMGLAGQGPITYHKAEGNYSNIFVLTAKKLWFWTYSMIDAAGQLFSGLGAHIFHNGKNASGQAVPGFQDIHGVLGVIKIGSEITRQDWNQVFLFTVLISLDLAIVNLIPFPPLDGSHLAFMAYEAVFRKPVNQRVQGEMIKWGTVTLLFLMALISVNDISAWMTGKLDLKHNRSEKDKEKEIESTKSPNKTNVKAAPELQHAP